MAWESIGRMVRRGFVAALLALPGCAADSGLGKEAAFSANDPQAAGDGVLLVGMQLTRPAQGYSLIFGSYEAPAEFEMVFRGVDAANRFTRTRRVVRVCDGITVGFGNGISGCDPLMPVHRLVRMPAGRYVLSDFVVRKYKFVEATNFVGGHSTFVPRHPPPPPPPALIAFDVKPGQITYIGDFNWDPQHFPARFVMSRNDNAAETELYAHPLVSAPVVFEPVMHVPVDAYPK